MRKQSGILLILAAICGFSTDAVAIEATALIKNDSERKGEPGIFLVHYPSLEIDTITTDMVWYACFSPDGKKVGFTKGGTFYTINTNGTGLTEVFSRSNSEGGFCEDYGMQWTHAGVFWGSRDHCIYRYQVETGQITKVLDIVADIGNICEMGTGFEVSMDGKRMWIKTGTDPAPYGNPDSVAGADEWYCGMRGYTRGARCFVQFNNDFTSFQKVLSAEWGHGNTMSADGYLFLVRYGQHTDLYVSRQNGSDTTIVHGMWDLIPPYGEEARNINRAPNNDSILSAKWLDESDNNRIRPVFWNWRTRELLGKFVWPCSHSGCERMSFAGLWYGPLPQANEPYISATPTQLVFKASSVSNMSVTITNSGAGTLGAIDASENAEWLSASVSGSGNSQTVTVTVDQAKLPAQENTTTITLSAGGAENRVPLQVTAYKSGALAAPTELSASLTGDEQNDVALSWIDNSDDETGFSVYRRKQDGGSWSLVGETGANATGYTDMGRNYPETYEYCVTAQRTDTESNASNTVPVPVFGSQWIRITSPTSGATIKPGEICRVEWEENRTSNVTVELSLDNGRTWTMLTIEGGILKNPDGSWDFFEWQVPSDIALGNAKLKVAQYGGDFAGTVDLVVSSDASAALLLPATGGRDIMTLDGKDALTFVAPRASGLKCALFDMHGRRVEALFVVAGSRRTLDLAPLPNGVYFITMKDQNGRSLHSSSITLSR